MHRSDHRSSSEAGAPVLHQPLHPLRCSHLIVQIVPGSQCPLLCLTIYRHGEHDKKNRKSNYRSLRLERDQVSLWSIPPSLTEEILKCWELSWWHSSWQMQQSFRGYDGTKTDLNRSAPSLGARRSPFSPAEALDHRWRLTITSQTWMSKGPLSCSTTHCTL